MKEKEMRELKVPWPKNIFQLLKFIFKMVRHKNDYGTAVYAMSMSAVATFYYMSRKVGASGFQASCADMDFIKRTRHYKNGFQIIDYGNIFYPQYDDNFPTREGIIESNKKRFKAEAIKLIKNNVSAAPRVLKRWRELAGLQINES